MYVDIIKMIRNNNIAVGMNSMKGYDTYFMLDYFDLLFHRNLTGTDKNYKEFWNIKDNHEEKGLKYKVAYKTLSLYTGKENVDEDIFKIRKDVKTDSLSTKPFLGIVQINFVHCIYEKEPSIEETLLDCEQKIIDCLKENGFEKNKKICYRIYRSSTSGDFCVVVKSAVVENIFKISTLINNLVVSCGGENFKFNTYTNIGIECLVDEQEQFLSFHEETIEENSQCEFALRLTTNNGFAYRIFQKIKKTNKEQINGKKVVIEPMEGLFGRYDFLLHLSMREFAEIYGVLCTSKVAGKRYGESSSLDDDGRTFMQLLQTGIEEGKIKIINERVLVPLSDMTFDLKEAENTFVSDVEPLEEREDKLKKYVNDVSIELKKKMKKFQGMENIFIEERRAFIDISRELWEVITTYVPQGMENDSHVNWQILISDLRVVFASIEKWEESYKECHSTEECKNKRVHFLEDLRLVTDAVNQYYKFLQNVNAQTWQSPLYEIQTQLDAEKMMIAYREFLYEYFYCYKEDYENSDDERPMIYPIVYPDMSIDSTCVMVAFQNERKLKTQLLICRVPSFEYYGRMFDMVPWLLHEASHSVRTLNRLARNNYLIEMVIRNIFVQAMYKLLNRYSNDYGYHKLGGLENNIVNIVVKTAVKEFKKFCNDKKEDVSQMGINFLEAELLEFLCIVFDQDIFQMEEKEDARNIKAIQSTLLHFLGNLGLLKAQIDISGGKAISTVSLVEQCADSADILSALLKLIYDTYYIRMTGQKPNENEWTILHKDNYDFEIDLADKIKVIDGWGIEREQQQDYSFSVRELNRLYGAWFKRSPNDSNVEIKSSLWKGCILEIRDKIESGFRSYEGFTELYRILNMVFGNGKLIDDEDVKRIGQYFNILLQDEVYDLVEREITIYRESYADLYMAAALGLNAFGYCRQMFQTVSDASIENDVEWAEATNVHRFRAVAAVLSGKEGKAEKVGENIQISMDDLLQKGKEYCHASLNCARLKINDRVNNNGGEKEKLTSIERFFDLLDKNIEEIFKYFYQEESVKEALEDSLLSVYLNPDAGVDTDDSDVAKAREDIGNKCKELQEELEGYQHVIYRIKCFIGLLDLVGENGRIIIGKMEYEHLRELYDIHYDKCEDIRENKAYKIVSEYYNDAQSAAEKSPEQMLEDTIQFIQTYYYKNRFKIMSSNEVKREVE